MVEEEEEEEVFSVEDLFPSRQYSYEEEEDTEEELESKGEKKGSRKRRRNRTLVYDEESGKTFVRKKRRRPEKDWEDYIDV